MGNPFETIYTRLTTIESLLLDIKHQRSSTADSVQPEKDQILNVKQASEFLKLAVPTVYSMVSSRRIISYKRGKKLYFKKSELEQWINSGKRSSGTELRLKTKQS